MSSGIQPIVGGDDVGGQQRVMPTPCRTSFGEWCALICKKGRGLHFFGVFIRSDHGPFADAIGGHLQHAVV